jgi:hypothetical protein
MEMIERAFKELYPEKEFTYIPELKFSGKFAPFNANIKLRRDKVQVCLSKSWRGVDKEIVVGLVQDLLAKLFGHTTHTMNMSLYNSFVRNIHLGIAKDRIDPALKRSFDRINEQFFSNQLEVPNLIWGNMSRRRLASYNFHTDTISVSRLFVDQEIELLDYVMYHEMLHKSMKFQVTTGQHRYHTTDFRTAEKAFPNSIEIEKRIKSLPIRKKSSFLGWLMK